MVISESTAAALALLTRAADDPDIDLEERMHAAIAAVEFAVTSYLGLTLTITVQGHEVSFTAGDHSENQAGTSLRIPLSLGPATEAASTLTLFAATPGAFVDLAADLCYALGTPNVDLALDEHLAQPVNDPAVTGLAEYSVINQAAGVLINRGHTLKSASKELRRLANDNDLDLHNAAESVMRSLAQIASHDQPDHAAGPSTGK